MNNTLKLAGSFLALALVGVAQAASINGDIHVTAFGGTAAVNTTTNRVTFNPVAPASNSQVSFVSGDWAGLLGTSVSYADFNYSPLSVDAVGGWMANTVWHIDADTFFVLSSITNITEGAVLGLKGLGTAYHNAFTPTAGLWSFSADSSGGSFSFSSTLQVPPPAVPDSGASIALLGSALVAMGLISRRRRA
jgi:hypothetical protein